MSQRTVVLDLASDHQLARDLVAGGVFVPGETLTLGEDVALVLRNGDAQLEVRATCVWLDGARGSGLQLVGCDAEMKQQIAAIAERGAPGKPEPEPAAEQAAAETAEQEVAEAAEQEVAEAAEQAAAEAGEQAAAEAGEQAAAEAGEGAAADGADDDARRYPQSMHERLRGLTLVQQLKVAQHGEIQERVLLERIYGKNVWEALLRNPRVTGPEVARIARMGALPRPLVEIIVGNGGWLQIPEVRRALLSNPRLGTDQILRVLRLLPKHELKIAAMQTAYPFAVRDAAKRMIRDNAGG